MRPSAARLIVFGAAGSLRRLIGIAAGVALGTGMVLILLGAYLHMPERDDRDGWTTSTGDYREFSESGDLLPIAPADDAVLLHKTADYFQRQSVRKGDGRHHAVDNRRVSRRIARPQSGRVLRLAGPCGSDRALSERPVGRQVRHVQGRVAARGAEGAGRGRRARGDGLGRAGSRLQRTCTKGFPTEGPHAESVLYRIVLGVGSVALLVPIALLIGIVSQLGAAARRERYATVRLIGAGQRTMAGLAALEMGIASLVGAAIGIGVAAALRPAAILLPINGTQSYAADLTPSSGWVVATVLGMAGWVPVPPGGAPIVTNTARWARSRERAEKPSTWKRVILLALGLTFFTARRHGRTTPQHQRRHRPRARWRLRHGGLWHRGCGFVAHQGRESGLCEVRTHRRHTGGRRTARSPPPRHLPLGRRRGGCGFHRQHASGVVSSVNGVADAKDEPGLLPLNAVRRHRSTWTPTRTPWRGRSRDGWRRSGGGRIPGCGQRPVRRHP